MPKAPRPQYEGAIYHVYQRGNNKGYIYKDSNSKVFLLKELKAYNKAAKTTQLGNMNIFLLH